MFVRQGEYSHGPLVGHRVPWDHMLFEARLSERDFPWMAEHRVHHASIMPAAGYIELVLEVFEGGPVDIEVLEFLTPCPIPKVPVRLQTALRPAPNAPDTFTFTVSSRSYDVDAKSELHCRGRVRRTSADHPVEVPMRLRTSTGTDSHPRSSPTTRDFYERLDAVPQRDLPVRPPLPNHPPGAGRRRDARLSRRHRDGRGAVDLAAGARATSRVPRSSTGGCRSSSSTSSSGPISSPFHGGPKA